MSTPSTSKRTRPCESCGDITGNCRVVNPEFILCFNVRDKSYTPNGWTFKGLDKAQGLWGQLKRGEDEFIKRTPEEKKAFAIEQAAIRALNKKEADRIRAELVASMPPAEKRDAYFKQQYKNNPLSLEHRAALHKKGCTDALIHKMEAYSTWRGWVIPTRNLEGLRTGAQLKLNGVNQKGYRWEGTGTNLLFETGQNPLTFCGNLVNPTALCFVEGLTIKPNKTAFEHPTKLVIGGSGGHFTASSKELQAVLDRFPNVPLELMPDAESIENDKILCNYRSLNDFIVQYDASQRELGCGWWGQLKKEDGDIDEIAPNTHIEIISWSRFEYLVHKASQVNRSLHSFKGFDSKLTVKRDLSKVAIAEQFRPTDATYSDVSDLIPLVESAIANPAIKVVLDISLPGSGKSTKWGKILGLNGANKLWYVNNQHRNPTTKNVRLNYADVPSRHNGLYIDPLKSTEEYRWLSTTQPKGENWVKTASNCALADSHKAWRDTGFDSPEGANPICSICPHAEACKTSSGDGWGYKYQKLGALANTLVRTSPLSMAPPTQYDYSNDVTIWDDQEVSISRKLVATKTDISRTIGTIYSVDPSLANELDTLFSSLHDRFNEPNHYGHDHADVTANVSIDNIQSVLDRVAAIVQPDLSNLHVEGATEKTHALAKWGFTVDRPKTLLNDITANWLVWSLEILADRVKGCIRVDGQTLTIKQRDTHHVAISAHSALTCVLNATKDRNDLALELGIEPSAIFVISQAVPNHSNLTINMVSGMGSSTSQRASSADVRVDEFRLALAEKHGDCSVLDHVKANTTRSRWFVDSVGSNAFEKDPCLLLIGQPRQNLGAVAEDYYMLTGIRVAATDSNPDYQAYVKRRVAGDVIQGVGRLRAQHRLDTPVNAYIACDREDYPIAQMMAAYPTATLKAIDCADICITSARSRVQLRAKFAELKLANPQINRAQAALQMATSPANVAAMFKEFGVNFKTGSAILYKALVAESDLATSDYADWRRWLVPQVIEEHIEILDSEVTEDIKADKVATHVQPLSQPQTSALFGAIGSSATNYTIELLRLNLALKIPTLTPTVNDMKTERTFYGSNGTIHSLRDVLDISMSISAMANEPAKNGETMLEIAEGLQYIAQVRDIAQLNVLREIHKDDKEALQIACELLSDIDRKIIKEMVVKSNSKKLVLKR